MPMRRSRNEQQRGDGFKALACRFLKALGYSQIEEEPMIGEKRADLLATTREGRFFVEAKSPHLMKDTLFDPEHFDRVKLFERDVT
ncbi:MAG: DNA/RNA nuclease SfsA [Acidobacteriota bacterium]|nr:DNA/RNA nuclease SfsA [Acidobacteriota bacterium]